MRFYRASRPPQAAFDPLDSRAAVARDGWRFNDKHSEILYTAEVEALALLEIVARSGWTTVTELMIAAIEIPDGCVATLAELGITLPRNWGMRPAAPNAQRIGGEFLAAVDRAPAAGQRLCGVRVPSVISTSDCNVLLDPRQRVRYKTVAWSRIPFDWLLTSST